MVVVVVVVVVVVEVVGLVMSKIVWKKLISIFVFFSSSLYIILKNCLFKFIYLKKTKQSAVH